MYTKQYNIPRLVIGCSGNCERSSDTLLFSTDYSSDVDRRADADRRAHPHGDRWPSRTAPLRRRHLRDPIPPPPALLHEVRRPHRPRDSHHWRQCRSALSSGLAHIRTYTVLYACSGDLANGRAAVLDTLRVFSSGLGYATTKELLRLGARRVVMACRDVQRGYAARRQIAVELAREDADGKVKPFEVEQRLLVRVLDLASLSSVRAFADAFLREFDRLDVLILNAGAPGAHTYIYLVLEYL